MFVMISWYVSKNWLWIVKCCRCSGFSLCPYSEISPLLYLAKVAMAFDIVSSNAGQCTLDISWPFFTVVLTVFCASSYGLHSISSCQSCTLIPFSPRTFSVKLSRPSVPINHTSYQIKLTRCTSWSCSWYRLWNNEFFPDFCYETSRWWSEGR
jgi:hypothetical protein